MTKIRIWIMASAFVLLAGAAGFSWYQALTRPHAVTSQVDPEHPDAKVGGPFTLVDQDGHKVDQSVLNGKWTAVFFGFTYCPDICPLTLQSLAQTQKAMGDKGRDLHIVFITVDPARDTPDALKTYLESGGFPQGVVGLTGTQTQIDAVEKAYGITADRIKTKSGYTFNHTAFIFLMNPKGEYSGVLTEDLPADKSAAMIKQIMAEPY
jgi:protein SCO1/2